MSINAETVEGCFGNTVHAQKSVYDVRRIDTAVFRLYGYPFRDIESLFDRFGKIVISVYHASLSALIRQIKNKISFAAANGSFTRCSIYAYKTLLQ